MLAVLGHQLTSGAFAAFSGAFTPGDDALLCAIATVRLSLASGSTKSGLAFASRGEYEVRPQREQPAPDQNGPRPVMPEAGDAGLPGPDREDLVEQQARADEHPRHATTPHQ